MSSHRMLTVTVLIVPFLLFVMPFALVKCEFINQPPRFMPGTGDMARFSLSENTPIDSPVYQLRGKLEKK